MNARPVTTPRVPPPMRPRARARAALGPGCRDSSRDSSMRDTEGKTRHRVCARSPRARVGVERESATVVCARAFDDDDDDVRVRCARETDRSTRGTTEA